MQPRLVVLAALLIGLSSPTAMANENLAPGNPMTRDAIQVPLSFASYEHRTGVTDYAVGGGLHLHSLLLGAAVRYHVIDRTENQLQQAHSPTDGVELEVILGNAGNLFSDVRLEDLCTRHRLKPEDCVFSNLDSQSQATYSERGPVWEAPVIALLLLGGSYQDLTMREPTDRSRERGQRLWGARARLAIGGYLDDAFLGLSAGVATVGAAPAQISYCTPLAPSGTELACTPSYLESYNRTTVVDARLEWRQAIHFIAANPAVLAVFQRSERDDVATPNDDTAFGLRYVDFDVPLYFYYHRSRDPGVYAGLRGTVRWWLVDRTREAELIGGVFVSVAYGTTGMRADNQRTRDRFFDDRFSEDE